MHRSNLQLKSFRLIQIWIAIDGLHLRQLLIEWLGQDFLQILWIRRLQNLLRLQIR